MCCLLSLYHVVLVQLVIHKCKSDNNVMSEKTNPEVWLEVICSSAFKNMAIGVVVARRRGLKIDRRWRNAAINALYMLS